MQIFADKKFENPIETIVAFDKKSFVEAFSRIEELRKQFYLLGYIRYEAKDIFLGKTINSENMTNLPLLYFEVFDKYKNYKPVGTENFIIEKSHLIDYKSYSNAIKKIKNEIALGNTYEVNYTYDWKVKSNLKGLELYNALLTKQKTPYNAYIKNEWEEILSFSPELFFELENNKIKTKPMKGTVKRGQTEIEDKKNIEFLKNDIKNRAENVMIVDLLRNDLGKIAKTGTVKVDKLFEIETHKSLHQMTSEITAELKENTTLYDIFEAIFPCGSITGAPKISTMEIIDTVETGKREIYCGAIGLITPKQTVFSVPIRILQKQNNETKYIYRVGGAIVWDSTAKEEWEETHTKIKFLESSSCHCEATAEAIQIDVLGLPRWSATPPSNDELDFKLVETILVKNGKMKYKAEHFNRMKKSAKKLGFVFNKDMLKTELNTLSPLREKVSEGRMRGTAKNSVLRILLSKDGHFETQYLPLDEIKTNKITISKTPVNSKEKFLYHKTTRRIWYNDTNEKIKRGEVFDEIFFNEKGELTEGSRSNVVLQIKGNLFTPPLKSGVLNGVLRQTILKKMTERKLYLDDLKKAEKIFCINSVRGIVEVELI